MSLQQIPVLELSRKQRPKRHEIQVYRSSGKADSTVQVLFNMPNLTKRDLVVKISNETGMVQHQVFEVIQKTLDQITSALSKGQDVELRNFGVFQVRLSKARVGRNPNIPGSNFAIPPRATVKFKSGKIMRRDVLNLSDAMKKGPGSKPAAKTGTRATATTSKKAAHSNN